MSAVLTGTPPSLRSLTWTVFAPMGVYGVGAGAATPMYALRALDLGASVGSAALIVAITGLGMVLTDLPAGRIVARIGERGAIAVATVFGTAGVLAAIFAPNLGVLAAGLLCGGVSGAVWGLARQTYIVAVVAPGDRGRALSTLAGAHRLGFFVGPFVGAALVHFYGPVGALWLSLATSLVSAAAVVAIRDTRTAGEELQPLHTVLAENRTALRTLGLAAITIGAARACRTTVLPLWAAHVGIGASTTSLIFGLAGAVDVAMSYPAGVWLDRFGSRVTGVPCALLFALGYAALPLTHTVWSVGAAALVLGLANGVSNGLVMTVGANIAPPDRRPEFLGAWRLMHDVGMFAGPLGAGALGAALGLAASGLSVAAAAVVGAAAIHRWFPGRVT
ncbi:MFS transporter [Nocardia thailandica]